MSAAASVKLSFNGSGVKRVSIGNIQNQGARDYQEDSFGFTPLDAAAAKNGFTAVVADGMGGLSAGDAVSAYVVSEVISRNISADIPVHLQLSRLMSEINSAIVAGGSGGGSTAAVVVCIPTGVYWCGVGDSRIYLKRQNTLCALSEDLDYQNQLLDSVIKGEMTYEEVKENPKKDALAQYIGYSGALTPDVNIKPLLPERGDKLLICSDGVYNAVSQEELENALSLHAGEAAEELERLVCEKNYSNQDNFSAIVLEFN